MIHCFPVFKKNQIMSDFLQKHEEYILSCQNLIFFTNNYWIFFLIKPDIQQKFLVSRGTGC